MGGDTRGGCGAGSPETPQDKLPFGGSQVPTVSWRGASVLALTCLKDTGGQGCPVIVSQMRGPHRNLSCRDGLNHLLWSRVGSDVDPTQVEGEHLGRPNGPAGEEPDPPEARGTGRGWPSQLGEIQFGGTKTRGPTRTGCGSPRSLGPTPEHLRPPSCGAAPHSPPGTAPGRERRELWNWKCLGV